MDVTPAAHVLIRLLSPSVVDDNLDIEAQTLDICIWAIGHDFRALLNGRDVTEAFSAPEDGIRRASFQRGADLPPGRGSFLAAVGAPGTEALETAGFHFTVWEVTEVKVPDPRASSDHGGWLTVRRASVGGRRLLTGKRGGHRLRLGGGHQGLGVALNADHGLIFGTNTVVLDRMRAPHHLERMRQTVIIPRTAPLVGAGRDRVIAAGQVTLLDGGATLAAETGSSLQYEWTILAGPEGYQAEIRDPRRRQAHFSAATPGRYRLRLTVTERAIAGHRSAAAEIEIAVTPTADPMGLPIETINERLNLQIGDVEYPRLNDWLSILVLDPVTLTRLSYTGYTDVELPQAKALIDSLSGEEIVILRAGLPRAHDYPTRWHPDRDAFRAIIAALGGIAETQDGWAILSNTQFSLIGRRGLGPGQAWQNSQTPPASLPDILCQAGNLKGFLQRVNGGHYSFVSTDAASIDTAAEGSDGCTRNTIKVGSTAFRSEVIADGDTAVQLVVLDRGLAAVANVTFVISRSGGAAVEGSAGDLPLSQGTGVKGLAAALAYFNRQSPQEHLVILQSFGQGPWWGNTPSGSPSWASDDVEAGNVAADDGTASSAVALYDVWNPGYATVAGQVGSLTSGAGHDIVAGFGQDPFKAGTPNGGLTVVGSTHPYDGQLNFVQGQTVAAPARLVGLLVRTRQWQWTVQNATSTPQFDSARAWQTVLNPGTAWPYAEGAGYTAAMAWIAGQLYPGTGILDVRPQYVLKKSADWDGLAQVTRSFAYPASGAFTDREFKTLQAQLANEMNAVASVRHLISQWAAITRDSMFSGHVNLPSLARSVVETALAEGRAHAGDQAGLDWRGIIGEALGVAEAVLRETGEAELAAPLGLVVGVFSLAAALMAPQGTPADTRDASDRIWNRADLLGQDLVTRFSGVVETLGHIEDLLISNWGRLEIAARRARGDWAFGPAVREKLALSLAVTTKRAFYKALLPLAYEPWAIAIDDRRGQHPRIAELGRNPPASLVDPLFQPVDPSDDSGNPTCLGMDKTRFFGELGDGRHQHQHRRRAIAC
jgi:hypothetical protein